MSTAEGRAAFLANAVDMPADDLLDAFSGTEILRTLEISNEDLMAARGDSILLETLRITYEILAALKKAGVLETFLQLPKTDQADFLRWIGMMDDRELRRERTETFALALAESPLGPS
jgi:hypothetical protein